MFDERRIANIYDEYVVAHELERTALFECLQATCAGVSTVLYPGSFIHVTPSFYFPHVVYVDRSDFSRDFFACTGAVADLVRGRRTYPREPFIRFVQQDFTRDLPFPEGSFDLLLALYAGGISRSCARYVKAGGWLLSNDHHGDAHEAAGIPELHLHAVLEERRGKLRVVDEGLEPYLDRVESRRPRHARDPKAAYFLFRKRVRRSNVRC